MSKDEKDHRDNKFLWSIIRLQNADRSLNLSFSVTYTTQRFMYS